MNYLDDILVPIAICCVLPISIVWLVVRNRMEESKNRMQIILAAIEKNSETDVEDLLRKMSPQKKLLKEKLLSKLLWGGIIAFLGVALLAFCVVQGFVGGMPTELLQQFSLFGAILLGTGIAFLVNYAVGKKFLAKEIEAEEKKMTTQA